MWIFLLAGAVLGLFSGVAIGLFVIASAALILMWSNLFAALILFTLFPILFAIMGTIIGGYKGIEYYKSLKVMSKKYQQSQQKKAWLIVVGLPCLLVIVLIKYGVISL